MCGFGVRLSTRMLYPDAQRFSSTGMRCLPAKKVPELGRYVLHDWHAEVLAIRSFNQLLLQECLQLARCSEYHSKIIQWCSRSGDGLSHEQPFAVRANVKIYMYSSEAPCGDASMELVMEAQDDPTPWPVTAGAIDGQSVTMQGRGSFSELGIVRRKPGGNPKSKYYGRPVLTRPARGDSPETLSKSCSDKIAFKQCTSLLDKHTCRFINPRDMYIDSLILPRSQYNPVACKRAFGSEGRMRPVAGRTWPGGYRYEPFTVQVSDLEFAFSRRSISVCHGPPKGSNISAVWNTNLQETLVNGVLQGRKQTDLRGASGASSIAMYQLASKVAEQLVDGHGELELDQAGETPRALLDRENVKYEVRRTALKGWVRNERSCSGYQDS